MRSSKLRDVQQTNKSLLSLSLCLLLFLIILLIQFFIRRIQFEMRFNTNDAKISTVNWVLLLKSERVNGVSVNNLIIWQWATFWYECSVSLSLFIHSKGQNIIIHPPEIDWSKFNGNCIEFEMWIPGLFERSFLLHNGFNFSFQSTGCWKKSLLFILSVCVIDITIVFSHTNYQTIDEYQARRTKTNRITYNMHFLLTFFACGVTFFFIIHSAVRHFQSDRSFSTSFLEIGFSISISLTPLSLYFYIYCNSL